VEGRAEGKGRGVTAWGKMVGRTNGRGTLLSQQVIARVSPRKEGEKR